MDINELNKEVEWLKLLVDKMSNLLLKTTRQSGNPFALFDSSMITKADELEEYMNKWKNFETDKV
jgi:hypothetical protein